MEADGDFLSSMPADAEDLSHWLFGQAISPALHGRAGSGPHDADCLQLPPPIGHLLGDPIALDPDLELPQLQQQAPPGGGSRRLLEQLMQPGRAGVTGEVAETLTKAAAGAETWGRLTCGDAVAQHPGTLCSTPCARTHC